MYSDKNFLYFTTYINYGVTNIHLNYDYCHRNQTSYENKTDLLMLRNHHLWWFWQYFYVIEEHQKYTAAQIWVHHRDKKWLHDKKHGHSAAIEIFAPTVNSRLGIGANCPFPGKPAFVDLNFCRLAWHNRSCWSSRKSDRSQFNFLSIRLVRWYRKISKNV